ncbi:MAG: hypothetical protein MJB12_08850 [Firmicutes bacterium]|nr:hypothetical protein [Bacillota bacterium]
MKAYEIYRAESFLNSQNAGSFFAVFIFASTLISQPSTICSLGIPVAGIRLYLKLYWVHKFEVKKIIPTTDIPRQRACTLAPGRSKTR